MQRESSQPRKIVILGVGNAHRGDDAVGLLVARQLRKKAGSSYTIHEHDGDGTSLIELWEGTTYAIVIDAMCAGRPPGTITRLDATLRPLRAETFSHTTHTFGLPEAVELSRALKRLPGRLVIFGIEGQNFNIGAPLTPAVQAAIETVVERVLEEAPPILAPALTTPTPASV